MVKFLCTKRIYSYPLCTHASSRVIHSDVLILSRRSSCLSSFSVKSARGYAVMRENFARRFYYRRLFYSRNFVADTSWITLIRYLQTEAASSVKSRDYGVSSTASRSGSHFLPFYISFTSTLIPTFTSRE